MVTVAVPGPSVHVQSPSPSSRLLPLHLNPVGPGSVVDVTGLAVLVGGGEPVGKPAMVWGQLLPGPPSGVTYSDRSINCCFKLIYEVTYRSCLTPCVTGTETVSVLQARIAAANSHCCITRRARGSVGCVIASGSSLIITASCCGLLSAASSRCGCLGVIGCTCGRRRCGAWCISSRARSRL